MPLTKATSNVIAPITATGSTTSRSLPDRFADVVNVKDFGAKGDGTTDDTAAIQAAVDDGRGIYFPDGYYNISGIIYLNNGNFLFGDAPTGASFGGTSYPQCAHLIFTGNNTSCFKNKNNSVGICHGGVSDLVIQTSNRDWIFDLNGTLGFSFIGVRMENQYATGGGFRSTKIDPVASNPTWLNAMINTEIRIVDNSTSYVMDIDWSDSDFSCCTFTGGKGVIDRGAGNTKYNNCQFERANTSGAGLTLTCYSTTSYKPTVVTGSCFDANDGYGLIIDGTSAGGSTYSPVISGCAFRNYTLGVSYEILLKNTSGSIVYGGTINGCSFVNNSRIPINFNESIWQNLNWIGNAHSYDFSGITDIGNSFTNCICDTNGLSIPKGLSAFYGSNTVRGMSNVSTYSAPPSSNYAGLMTGSINGNSPFIAASRQGNGTATNLNFVTDNSIRLQLLNNGSSFWPYIDNSTSLGYTTNRWSVVYAGTGTINTSDKREKQQIRTLSESEKAVAVRLKGLIKAFKFNDAVEKKSEGARIHFGVIAQEVKTAFECEGLIAENYAILCYDEWDTLEEIKDNEGNVIQPYRKAGNRYGVRYDELFAFIISQF